MKFNKLHVVVACHAGGRGFESRRSRQFFRNNVRPGNGSDCVLRKQSAAAALEVAILRPMVEVVIDQQAVAKRGKRLEYFTIAWNCLEGLVAVVAGAIAGSISLIGFGIDSFIEVTSGAVLLWRMAVDSEEQTRERNERLSLRIVGACFLALSTVAVEKVHLRVKCSKIRG